LEGCYNGDQGSQRAVAPEKEEKKKKKKIVIMPLFFFFFFSLNATLCRRP
jgi:hypothetical protein